MNLFFRHVLDHIRIDKVGINYSNVMDSADSLDKHRTEHSSQAVSERLATQSRPHYLRDFVYGAMDGAVTTFAVVAGVAGAGLSSSVLLILGLASLFADGLSMAASCYLGIKSEIDRRKAIELEEQHHIEVFPEGEKEEIRQIFAQMGFSGEDLERIVKVISEDKKRWINTMIRHEFGLPLHHPNPIIAALVTFFSFIIIGSFPLVIFLLEIIGVMNVSNPFGWACILAGISFFIIGSLRCFFTGKHWITSGFETFTVGSVAASVAYFIGLYLTNL